MSVSRTPPKTSSKTTSPSHHRSDPVLYSLDKQGHTEHNITKRSKRRLNDPSDNEDVTLSDLMSRIDEIKKQQDDKFAFLESSIIALSTQNDEIKTSVIHMSAKYDDVLSNLKILQQENNYFKKQIKTLEEKMEQFERNTKSTSIEVRNIPKNNVSENKDNLVEIAKTIGTVINAPIEESDIRDIYRLKLKEKPAGPIIIDFLSTIKRENFIRATRTYNKVNKEQRLSTATMKMIGPAKPIYVTESLTASARRLHYLARQFSKSHNFEYCWTSFGKVYVKRSANEPRVLLSCEDDIENLKKNI